MSLVTGVCLSRDRYIIIHILYVQSKWIRYNSLLLFVIPSINLINMINFVIFMPHSSNNQTGPYFLLSYLSPLILIISLNEQGITINVQYKVQTVLFVNVFG